MTTALSQHVVVRDSQDPSPDLIILDLDEPSPEGPAGRVHAIRSRFPEVPVVVTGTEASPSRVVEVIRAGAEAWLERPLESTRVTPVLDAVLARRDLAREQASMRRTLTERSRQVEGDRRELTRRLAEMGAELQAAHDQLQGRVAQLNMLYRIGRNLSRNRNWDAALKEFLDSLCGFLEAEGAAVLLSHRSRVRPRSVHGLDAAGLRAACRKLSGRSGDAGDMVWALEDVSDPRELAQRDAPWRSTVVPLHHRGRALGFLLIRKPYEAARSWEADRHFLTTIQTILTEEVAGAQVVGELRDLQRFHERTLDHVDSGILSLDQEGRLLYRNHKAADLLGEVPVGETLDPVLRVGSERLPFGDWLAGVGDGAARPADAWLERADGEIIPVAIAASGFSTEVPGERQHVAVLEDLRARRELEAERRRAARQDELLIMAAEWAHDVRTPLTGILHGAELLATALPEDSPKQKHFGMIQGEVERINELVTNFLDFARPARLKRQAVALEDLAAEVVELMDGPAHDRGCSLLLRRAAGPAPEVSIDVAQMKQVLLNLVTNALDASPTGGAVTIRVGVEETPPDADLLPASPHVAILEVSDEGPGVAAEHLDRLFIPFFTTKPHGSGLGLAICDKVVRAHDGMLRYLRRGDATVMRTVLPLVGSVRPGPPAVPLKARG